MHIEVNTIDIENYNIGILKGQSSYKSMWFTNFVCNFHNTDGNLEYGHAICSMDILLRVCIIFQISNKWSYFRTQ